MLCFILLKVKILIKLCGVRDLGHLAALGALGLDKVPYKLLGEYATCGEVVVVSLESGESLLERGRKSLELCLLFLGEVEEVEVVGAPAFSMDRSYS